MRPFLAVCRDGIREALDKRSLVILLVLGFGIVVFCFGLSFETSTLVATLERHGKEIGVFRSRTPGLGHFTSSMDADYSVSWARAATEADSLPSDFGADAAIIEVRPEVEHSLDALIMSWRWFVHRRETGENPDPQNPPPAFTNEDREDFLRERFIDFGYTEVYVRATPDSPPVFEVAVRGDRLDEIEGASRLEVLFGAFEFPLSEASLALTIVGIQTTIVNTLVGFIGMLMLLSTCAGFVPDMMQKGTIDLVLARPIGRVRLLLYKYAAAVLFVFVYTTPIIAGCALGLWVGNGVFNPWFLASPLSATLVFAVLYPVAVLVGVVSRSGNVAALCAAGVWGLSSLAGQMHHHSAKVFPNSPAIRALIEDAYVVLPKVSDIGTLNSTLLATWQLSPESFDRVFESVLPAVDWTMSVGTTAGFLVVCLALAAWLFQRRDF